MSKVSFKDLPSELRAMVIELTLTRVRSDKTYPMDAAADEALRAAQVLYGVDPAKVENEADEEEAGWDPSQDSVEHRALANFLQALFDSQNPTEHCGKPNCDACNSEFGEPKATEPEGKPKYTLIKGFGIDGRPLINVYRLKANPLVYAVTQEDRTVILKGGPVFDIPVEMVQQILDQHGRTDVSLGYL